MIKLSETYTYEGHKNWETGKRVTAQRRIKTGDTVTVTFLGASEEHITVNTFNGCWDVYDDIPAIGENYYFEVVVNGGRTYYGKYAEERYTDASVGTGGVVYGSNHDYIDEEQVHKAFNNFKEWLTNGAKDNNYWHGLYVKKEFPETISYGMPGEVIEPVIVTANGLTEGEEFTEGIFTYTVLSADDATVAVTGHPEAIPEVLEIPGHINRNGVQLTVTEIGKDVFKNDEGIREIILPETITAIRDGAFYFCKGVRKFTCLAVKPPVLGDPDEDIVTDPFVYIDKCDCPLFVPATSIDKYRSSRKALRGWRHFFNILPIGGAVEPFPDDFLPVFDKTWKKVSFIDGKPKPKLEGIQNIWVEEGTAEIPDKAFAGKDDVHCVYIPSSVRKIGKGVFTYCQNLEHLYFEDPAKIRFDSLEEMFAGCDHLSDLRFLRKWNTSKVKSTKDMFWRCERLKDLSPISGWDTGALEDASRMFQECDLIDDLSPLSCWDVSALKKASDLFRRSGITNVNALSSWSTCSLEDMSYIFAGCDKLTDIRGLSGWDTSKVVSMQGTFVRCKSLKDYTPLASWKTGNVRDMSHMFSAAEEGEAPIFPRFADWDTGKIETLHGFFEERKDIKNLDCLAGMNINGVKNLWATFSDCSNLTDISALATWDVSNVVEMRSLFDGCRSLKDLSPLAGWEVRRCKDPYCLFGDCASVTELSALKDWKLESATSLGLMFAQCAQLTDISALSSWNVRRVESLHGMFLKCSRLSDISALSSWDVSNVEDVSSLFSECESLEDLTPLKDWDTSLFLDLDSMFKGCTSLTDVSPIAHWNMRRKEKHFNELFKGCSKLIEVGCLDWRHGSAYITDMFANCGAYHYQMECAYKAPKDTVETPIKTVESFDVKEGADGVIEFSSGSLRFEMVPVEGGTYTMGYMTDDPNYRYSYENEPREETVGDFYIGRTQVTQALWEAVMGSNPSLIPGPKLPVEWVSPEECKQFVRKLRQITGLRFNLPTQAEWEYAARGGKYSHGYRFAGSDDLDEVAWHVGNTQWSEHPVGLKKPNELGLYDMTGNVNEMCRDKDDYYTDSNITRGGSYIDSDDNWCKITCYHYTSDKTNHVGLRLVLYK